MRFRRYFRRFLLAGAVAGAAWAPAAGASTVDQIGGQLVPSSQISSLRAHVQPTKTLPLRLLPADDRAQLQSGASHIGGYSSSAVPQSYLSKLPADIRASYLKVQSVHSSTGGTSASTSTFDWRDTVIGIVAFLGTCAVLGTAYLTRRRTSLRPV